MKFLSPSETKAWYYTSLQYSGYKFLTDFALRVWKTVLSQGHNALPPGFVGALLEKLTHQPMGKTHPKENNLENQFISLLVVSKGFTQLEGEFIMMDSPDLEKAIAVVKKIADKIGTFIHPKINFSEKDLKYAFLDKNFPEEIERQYFEYLEEIYQTSIDKFLKGGYGLDEVDLFEIIHPHLFESYTAKTIYRKIHRTIQGISGWLGGDLSLQEENEHIAFRYGEPQTLPLGGYDSITRKGNISSLVPSELAFIEETESIDYFDYKYLENELLYFQREEGIVFRIRRCLTLSIEMTYDMEHERNLSDLLSFCIVIVEKFFRVFSKDIIELHICLYGYIPSQMLPALEFLKYYLKETTFDEKVYVHLEKSHVPKIIEREDFQQWIIGKIEIPEKKFIPFEFPIAEDYQNLQKKYRLLADTIDRIVETVVSLAHN